VRVNIIELSQSTGGGSVIDIGAGLSPHKNILEKNGFSYHSQDFNLYEPLVEPTGLQNEKWEYPEHDFVCDILEMPTDAKFDLVVCTEVLEHVPDPVASFELLSRLVKPNGYILITVPFNSMMHQAPHWYAAGLSPFWFQYWSKKLDLKIVKLEISGDYVDVMTQEFKRLFDARIPWRILKPLVNLLQKYRKRLPDSILTSGGSEFKNIVVSDVVGKIIFTASGTNENTLINLNNVSNGIYQVKIFRGASVDHLKIVKQ